MKKLTPRKKIVGFGSWIKRTKESRWERVGALFNSRGEASQYLRHHHKAYAMKVEAIRFTMVPRLPGTCWADVRG